MKHWIPFAVLSLAMQMVVAEPAAALDDVTCDSMQGFPLAEAELDPTNAQVSRFLFRTVGKPFTQFDDHDFESFKSLIWTCSKRGKPIKSAELDQIIANIRSALLRTSLNAENGAQLKIEVENRLRELDDLDGTTSSGKFPVLSEAENRSLDLLEARVKSAQVSGALAAELIRKIDEPRQRSQTNAIWNGEQGQPKQKVQADENVLASLYGMYVMTKLCADNQILFSAAEVEPITAEIKKLVDQSEAPKDMRNRAWSTIQRRLAITGSQVTEQSCADIRLTIAALFPGAFPGSNEESPF